MVDTMRALAAVALIAAISGEPKAAPDFTLRSLDGQTVHLAALRGRVVLVNFWATWCAGCRVEMPRLTEEWSRHHREGLEIIGVSMDDAGPDVIARFARSKHVHYTIAKGNEAVAKLYGGARFLPQTVVIDRRGKIVKSFAGPPDQQELDGLIRQLLTASPGNRPAF